MADGGRRAGDCDSGVIGAVLPGGMGPAAGGATCTGCCAAPGASARSRRSLRAAGVWRSRMMRKATYPASELSTTTASATGSRLLSRPSGPAAVGAWSAGGAKHACVLAIKASCTRAAGVSGTVGAPTASMSRVGDSSKITTRCAWVEREKGTRCAGA